MQIINYSHNNPGIDIIEIKGELTGSGAVMLEEYLHSFLDEGKRSMLINLKHLKKADGLGLNVLEKFINRGLRIRLFNAGLEILNLLKISEKEDVIKLYKCKKPHEAVLLFEKEMREEKSTFKDDVKRRRFQRVNTSLRTEFKIFTSYNGGIYGEISYRAFIENISEGGILVNIIAFAKKTEDSLAAFEMVGKELHGINFSLNGGSEPIEANGECVWEDSVYEDRYAGIRFTNLKQNHNEMIKDYVCRKNNN